MHPTKFCESYEIYTWESGANKAAKTKGGRGDKGEREMLIRYFVNKLTNAAFSWLLRGIMIRSVLLVLLNYFFHFEPAETLKNFPWYGMTVHKAEQKNTKTIITLPNISQF